MEEEIKVLFNNLRLLEVDLDQLQKQTRVPVSAQMFQKSNPKGMALLVYACLCLFDFPNDPQNAQGKIRTTLNPFWFPYSMVEMREFKQTACKICEELSQQNRIGVNDLTKGVMETASGVRMWQALRQLSDAALWERLSKNVEMVSQVGLPTFKLTGTNIKDIENTKASSGFAVPSRGNIDAKALERAIRSCQCQVNLQEEQFIERAQQFDEEQKDWKQLSQMLTDEFLKEKKIQDQLILEGRRLGVIDPHSDQPNEQSNQLVADLKSEGISVIERVPQLRQIREAGQQLNSMLNELDQRTNLMQNIEDLLGMQEGQEQ